MSKSLMVKELKQWRQEEGLVWNPNWVPSEFESAQDLEEKYAEAEDAAQRFEQNMERAAPALPPARPRKTASSQYVTKQYLEKKLDRLCEAMGEFVAKTVNNPLLERIKALEEAPAEFMGAWREDQVPYRERSMVAHGGSCWFARVETSQKPSESRDWVLVAKRGADGKDLKK